MSKKLRERDIYLQILAQSKLDKKAGKKSVYLPEIVETGFLSSNHDGSVNIWCDRKNKTIGVKDATLEELLWRHSFVNRKIVDIITGEVSFVLKYKAWRSYYGGKPCRKLQVSVHRVLENGFSSRQFKCILTDGKCNSKNCSPNNCKWYWELHEENK